MKGDFSRLTFDPRKQFTRVLMQQGRVQLDADWNEQAGILLHYLQALAADLIGPFGGPETGLGFAIEAVENNQNELTDLKLGKGRYYVDGLLCENLETKDVSYFEQPDLALDPEKEKDKLPGAPFLAYLDVWERHVNHLQVDGIREVALGGPDTASRAQVVWQVRVAKDLPEGPPTEKTWPNAESWKKWVEGRQQANRGSLKARAKGDPDSTDPCLASPEARYRGPENQLYRVEIQWQEVDPNANIKATRALTFKWSRENGSVVFAIREVEGRTVVLESLGRDEATGLKRGDWVEIVDDDTETGGRSWSLMKVDEIHEARMSVTLKAADDEENPDLPVYEEGEAQKKHALLRRWDHAASPAPKTGEKPKGAVLFVFKKDAKPDEGWLTLEQGIQIQFQSGTYRPGDYWLIPARTATEDVEWPGPATDPQAVPPHGVEHHYAPLALVEAASVKDLRSKFEPLGVRVA